MKNFLGKNGSTKVKTAKIDYNAYMRRKTGAKPNAPKGSYRLLSKAHRNQLAKAGISPKNVIGRVAAKNAARNNILNAPYIPKAMNQYPRSGSSTRKVPHTRPYSRSRSRRRA